VVLDGDLVPRPTTGGDDSNLYREQANRTDSTSTAINESVELKRFSMDVPDMDKYWGELSIIGKAQTSGTMDVGLAVGDLSVPTPITSTLEWT